MRIKRLKFQHINIYKNQILNLKKKKIVKTAFPKIIINLKLFSLTQPNPTFNLFFI